MTAQAEFEKQFHSISGITIGERRKNLHGLLHQVKTQQDEIDFAAINPKTPLEDVFKVETLIFFRKTDDLLQVLHGDNSVLIKRVLKASHWFINSSFENVNGEELITNVFSKISYNTKLKLLHKIAKFSPSTQKSDEYFQTVQKNYNLFLAARLLESCSENLILRCIENYSLEITPRQLLTIVKKYPKITESIFELLEKQNYKDSISEKYEKVFVFLSQSNGSLFLKLYDKYKPNLTFGKRKTKSFISQNKDYVIKNSNKIYDILKLKSVYNVLKSDYEEYFYNLLPKSLHQFQDNYDQCLYRLNQTSLPKPKQFSILVKLFKKLYGSEIWEFPRLVTFELLELMSPDDREVWMQNHTKPKNLKDEVWISLMKTEKSIPLLIENISLTSNIQNRSELILTLLCTCQINNDLNALLRVLEYVTRKHRNDDIAMRQTFFMEVSHKFDLTKFSEEHWNYLMKFVRIYLLDKNYAFNWLVRDLYNGYIYYNCLHKLDIYDLILEWVKLDTGSYNLCQKVPEYEKLCLRIIAEVIPKAFTEKKQLEEQYRSYLSAVVDYNERNPKDRMSYFENSTAMLNVIKQSVDPDLLGYTEYISAQCLKFEFKLSLATGLVEIYFNKIENGLDSLFNSFLKRDPESFAKIVLPVLGKWCKSPYLCYLKYYEHLGIPQKFNKSYVTTQNALIDADSLKPNDMQSLSSTMKPKDYLSLVSSFCSDDLVRNYENETEQRIYDEKKTAISCLKNITPPEIALGCLVQFCQGDYLKLSVGSLHSLCDQLSESKIMNFIDILNNREVSIRKHSVYLVFRLLNKKAISEFVEKLVEDDKSMSIRKFILRASFKLFLNTQEQNDFEFVKENVKAMDLKDTEAYTIITKNIKKVSPKYFQEFIVFIWDFLENVQNPGKTIVEGKNRILSAIDDGNIGALPKEFCTQLIENYLFKSKEYDAFETDVEAFSSRYIIYHNLDDLNERIRFVLSIAQRYVQSNWYNTETYLTAREFISNFFIEFSKTFLSKKCKSVEILESFLKIWKNLFEPSEIYNEFLHLNLSLLYIKSIELNSSIVKIGEKLGKFCNDLDSKGLLNMMIFCNVFETFKADFALIYEDDDPNESFLFMAEGVLAKNSTPSGFMLAMFLLPDVENLSEEYKEKYKNIFNQIIGQKEPGVQIFIHKHFLNKVTECGYSRGW